MEHIFKTAAHSHSRRRACMPPRCSPEAGDTLFIAKNKHISRSPTLVLRRNTHPTSINKGERGTMLTVWTAGGDRHYFQRQLWQNCSFLSFGCPLPSLPRNIWIIHDDCFKSFGEVLFGSLFFFLRRNDLLVIQLSIFPEDCWFQDWLRASVNVSLLQRLLQIWKFLSALWKKKSEFSLFVVTDCVQSWCLLWQTNLGIQ